MRRCRTQALLLFALALPSQARGQTLTLSAAMAAADSAAFANRVAAGEAEVQAAERTSALRGILPGIRAEAGWVRSNDPLAAFGFELRQRTVSMASFDPATLNYPPPISNWNGGLVAEVPLVNVDAWYARSATARAASAADAAAGWVRESTRVQVVRAYYGVILARESVRTLESAVEAGRAHLHQAESMVANGLATRSDQLLAGVQEGQVEAQLIAARAQAADARQRLALLLGQPGDTSVSLPDSLPSADRIRLVASGAAADSGAARLDVTAAEDGLAAADRGVRSANAQYLPRINGFGRYDWNDPNLPFGGQGSYTVGVMVSWSPFAGGADLGARHLAQGRAAAARAAAEAARAGAAIERDAARSQLQVSLAQLAIAEGAVAQGAEAHRIVERKYTGGLATVAELLGAATVETQARLGLSAARYQAIVTAAAARQAAGQDLLALTSLEN